MRRRYRYITALASFITLPVVLIAACSGRTVDPGVNAPDGGVVGVDAIASRVHEDASDAAFILDADAQTGPYGPWYSPAAIPTGACKPDGAAVVFRVNPCCKIPDSPELQEYRCECRAAEWACTFNWGGAGFCGDGAISNNWRKECD